MNSALVFGATGQVARELTRTLPSGWNMTSLGRDHADLGQPETCVSAIQAQNWDVVINAAAYTAVDQAETDKALATMINGTTPGIMAQTCAHQGIPFLHVSTDYVFDGSGEHAWTEAHDVSPQNAYGRSKLAGEQAVAAVDGAHVILRTSWVFSAHGSNFVKTMLRLASERDRLTIVADQIGGPTPAASIADALWRIAQAQLGTAPSGIYHFAGAPAVSWANFAREIFAQAQETVDVVDIPSTDFPTPAQRPLNSRLDCAKLASDFGITPPQWKAGLAAVLQDLRKT